MGLVRTAAALDAHAVGQMRTAAGLEFAARRAVGQMGTTAGLEFAARRAVGHGHAFSEHRTQQNRTCSLSINVEIL